MTKSCSSLRSNSNKSLTLLPEVIKKRNVCCSCRRLSSNGNQNRWHLLFWPVRPCTNYILLQSQLALRIYVSIFKIKSHHFQSLVSLPVVFSGTFCFEGEFSIHEPARLVSGAYSIAAGQKHLTGVMSSGPRWNAVVTKQAKLLFPPCSPLISAVQTAPRVQAEEEKWSVWCLRVPSFSPSTWKSPTGWSIMQHACAACPSSLQRGGFHPAQWAHSIPDCIWSVITLT